ncbi:hypothetical protein V500_07607 [Pseudogymnoascus sp. VKM F-4518 (FW-2643)]|nr:hypothetical protein V500_07607 [Pseudogymnoascus sp. VKM F-4518 (FW-2643)]
MASGIRSRSQSSSSKDDLLDQNRISDLEVLQPGKNGATAKYGFKVGDDDYEAKRSEFHEKVNSHGDTVMALGKYWTDDIEFFNNNNIDSKGKGKAAYVESESEEDDKQEKNTQESELENEQESEESEEQGEEESGQQSEEESGQQSEEDNAQNQNRPPTRRDLHEDSTPSKTPAKVAFADTTSVYPMTPAREKREQRLAAERRQQEPIKRRRSIDEQYPEGQKPIERQYFEGQYSGGK